MGSGDEQLPSVRRRDGDEGGGVCMKLTVYRVKLKDFQMRVLINVLNESRKAKIASGEQTDDITDLLLKLLDIAENH